MNLLPILALLAIAYLLYNSGAVFLGTLAGVAAIIWALVESSGSKSKAGEAPSSMYPPYPPYPTEIKFKPSFEGDIGPVIFAKGVGSVLDTLVKIAWGITKGGKK